MDYNLRNSYQRSMSVGDHSALSYPMTDVEAQLEHFVKTYVLYWDLGPNVTLNVSYASQRLPKLYATLQNNKTQDLTLVIDILKDMLLKLPNTLSTESQGLQELISDLQQAINETNQVVKMFAVGNTNSQFGPIISKDLQTSNDIMAAALLLKQYFNNLINT
ncbi:hypothetical protein ACF0H5_015940 [Mactra antiquata]